MNTPATYAISNPHPFQGQLYHGYTAEENVTIDDANQAAMVSLTAFIKAAGDYHQKGWKVEMDDKKAGIYSRTITVDGHWVNFKFAEKWVLVQNGGGTHTSGFYKMSTQLYYLKPLTMKDHGKKVVDIISSMINHDIKLKNKRNVREINSEIARHAMKYLVTKYHFVQRESVHDKSSGYSPMSDENCIGFSFRFGNTDCSFRFSMLEESFGKITMLTSTQDKFLTPLNISGTYEAGGLMTKYDAMAETVKLLERELSSLIKYWPEAVADAKQNGL